MDPQIFQKGVQRTPKFENLDISLPFWTKYTLTYRKINTQVEGCKKI